MSPMLLPCSSTKLPFLPKRFAGEGVNVVHMDVRVLLHGGNAVLAPVAHQGNVYGGVFLGEAEGMVLHPRRPSHVAQYQHHYVATTLRIWRRCICHALLLCCGCGAWGGRGR